MINRRSIAVMVIVLVAAVCAFAADINGKWQGTMQGGGGPGGGDGGGIVQKFTFQVSGEKIAGTMSDDFIGEAKITAGTIKGDEIAFTVSGSGQMGEMTLSFKGKVTGPDEIKVTFSAGGGGRGEGGPGGAGPGAGPGGDGGGRGPGGAMEVTLKRVK
jgi:hypothetical protein